MRAASCRASHELLGYARAVLRDDGLASVRTHRVRQMGARANPNAPSAFHLLAKPTGAVCNLDCSYCFFLSKEMLYPGSRFRMADDLLETYIGQLVEAHAHSPYVTIAWQGG